MDRTAPAATSYDEIPYLGKVRRSTHPARIAANATLFGLQTPAVETARILELGCGDAANLLSIANSLPESTCVGIDLSATHIELGNRTIKSCGFENITLVQGSLEALTDKEAPFDYIICHGLFSWVSPEIQDLLLRSLKQYLSPAGMAFISYNCLPGWHIRQISRDLMRYRTRGMEGLLNQADEARDCVISIIEAAPESPRYIREIYEEEAKLVNSANRYYVAHEHLEEDNHPYYFHEFAEKLQDQGLRFVCESELPGMKLRNFPSALRAWMQDPDDLLEAEQLLDFATLRKFRQSLITHTDQAPLSQPAESAIEHLHYTAIGELEGNPDTLSPAEFKSICSRKQSLYHPIAKRLFLQLSSRSPLQVSGQDLIKELASTKQEKTILVETLMSGVLNGVITPWAQGYSFPTQLIESDRPLTGRYVRHQIENQTTKWIGSLRHELMQLTEQDREILILCNGQRHIEQIAAAAQLTKNHALAAVNGFAQFGLIEAK